MLGNSLYLDNLKGRLHKTLCFFIRVNFTRLSSAMFKMFWYVLEVAKVSYHSKNEVHYRLATSSTTQCFVLNIQPLKKIEATVKFKGPFYSTNLYFVPFGTDEIG